MVFKKKEPTVSLTSLTSLIKVLKLLIPLSLIILVPFVNAIPNDINEPSPIGIYFKFYGYSPATTLDFISTSQDSYFDKAIVTNKFVNFTNLVLGKPGLINTFQPFQSFGIGTENGNATLALVSVNSVGVIETFVSGTPKLFFYYKVQYPSNATVITSTIKTIIPSTSYFTDTALFNSCVAPCAFLNDMNNTLIVKEPNASPTTTYFCSVGDCPFNIIIPASSPDSNVALPLIFLFFVIVALVLILAFSRKD